MSTIIDAVEERAFRPALVFQKQWALAPMLFT